MERVAVTQNLFNLRAATFHSSLQERYHRSRTAALHCDKFKTCGFNFLTFIIETLVPGPISGQIGPEQPAPNP